MPMERERSRDMTAESDCYKNAGEKEIKLLEIYCLRIVDACNFRAAAL